MDIRNRIADVNKIRCKVCQDFFRMILEEGWQQQLYNKAKDEVDNHNSFIFKETYERMRDIGSDNYNVEDMDITLMNELIQNNFSGRKNVKNPTRKILKQLKDDRNVTAHSNENEEIKELYLRGILDLYKLKEFIRTVDQVETGIENNQRIAYRQKYFSEINSLIDLLDEERIELIQRDKDFDKDIRRIKESENPFAEWCDIYGIYMERYWKIEKNPQKVNDFCVRASDAGIVYAHYYAALYYFYIKDFTEFERRIYMLCSSKSTESYIDVKSIIGMINEMCAKGYELTEGIKELINIFKNRGYIINTTEEGLYKLEKL